MTPGSGWPTKAWFGAPTRLADALDYAHAIGRGERDVAFTSNRAFRNAIVIGVADSVPRFNLNAVCAADGMRGPDVCVKSETAARDDLAKQWAQFPAVDRARCVQLATMSKMPSYVQVLTCLEMAREARQIKDAAGSSR